MRFTVSKSEIAEAAARASKACAIRSTIPILEGLMISVENNIVTVTGYDCETGIRCIIAADQGAEDGSIVVNAKLFEASVRKMPKETVEISTKDKTVILHSGRATVKLTGSDAKNYPSLSCVSSETTFEIEAASLKKIIQSVIYAVSLVDIKPALMGVLFRVQDGILTAAASDGVRLAVFTEPVECSDIDVIIPRKVLGELVKMLDEGRVTVQLDKKRVCFVYGDFVMISQLINGEFIKYERIINSAETSAASVNVPDMCAMLERTCIFSSADKFKLPVKCVFDDNNLSMTINSALGDTYEDLPIVYDGDKISVGFNARYMLDALKNCGSSEAKITFDRSNYMRITAADNAGYQAVVLPVRTK